MPILIVDNGTNNRVEISEDLISRGNGKITLDGNNNVIVVESSALALGGHFHLIGGASVVIGARVNASQLFVHAVVGAKLRIGGGVGFNGLVRLMMHEQGQLSIGDGCLIAAGVDITISDMHSIIDVATQKRVNYAKDITIGNKVWIGQGSLVLKGAQIGDDSIIGAQSVVTGAVPPNCAAAGNPARLIRPNVTWDERLI